MLAGRSVSEVERLEMAETWFEYLGETIPAGQLDAAFRRAVLDHTTPYAINAFEMQMAYRAIKAEAEFARAKAEDDERYRREWHIGCVCNAERFVMVDGKRVPCGGR